MEYLLFRENVPSNLVAAMGPSVSICIPQETTTTSLRIATKMLSHNPKPAQSLTNITWIN